MSAPSRHPIDPSHHHYSIPLSESATGFHQSGNKINNINNESRPNNATSSSHFSKETNSLLLGLVSILFFIFIKRRENIVYPFRKFRFDLEWHSNPSHTALWILTTPMSYLIHVVSDTWLLLCQLVNDPWHTPQVLYRFLALFINDAREFIEHICYGVLSLMAFMMGSAKRDYIALSKIETSTETSNNFREEAFFSSEGEEQPEPSWCPRKSSTNGSDLASCCSKVGDSMPELEVVERIISTALDDGDTVLWKKDAKKKQECAQDSHSECYTTNSTWESLRTSSENEIDSPRKRQQTSPSPSATSHTVKRYSTKRTLVRYDMNDLEPAFLSVEDYPPGWLVYHSKYGVITREEKLRLESSPTS